MGELRLLQENNQNYVVCNLEEQEELDEECLATISGEQAEESQEIIGIIPAIFSQVFEERILRYDVNAFTPLQEYLGYSNTRDKIITLFISIMEIYQNVDAFLLDASCFVLDKEFIFVDKASGEAHLIMYPVYGGWKQKELKKLFRDIMQNIPFGKEDMEFYGMVMYELNQTESFSVSRFKEQLQELQKVGGETAGLQLVAARNTSQYEQDKRADMPPIMDRSIFQESIPSGSLSGDKEPLTSREIKESSPEKLENPRGLRRLFGGKTSAKEKKEKNKGKQSAGSLIELPDQEVKQEGEVSKDMVHPTPAPMPVPQPSSASVPLRARREKTSFNPSHRSDIPMTDDELEDYGGTVDDDGAESYIVLYYVSENRYITAKSFPFEMGREGRDLKIAPNKNKVSRKHAEIILTPEGFKLCDYSKLGTFLDGIRIPKGQAIALKNGMRMMLKDEEFVVNIYEN